MGQVTQQTDRRAEQGRQRRARTRAAIIAAAFAVFGDENGLYARIEDIVEKAGVTRATFYNHFTGMAELREARTHEVTHEFLDRVTGTLDTLPDPREQSAVAIRLYLKRARSDPQWGWSMMNMSASGAIFGRETHDRAEGTIAQGMAAGVLRIPSAEIGRDILLGATLAAMGTIVKGGAPDDYPETVAGYILCGLGVDFDEARRIACLPLPALASAMEIENAS